MSDGGKGSSPRPFSVSQQTYANNYDRIFRKSPKEIDDDLAEAEEFAYLAAIQNFQQIRHDEREERQRDSNKNTAG